MKASVLVLFAVSAGALAGPINQRVINDPFSCSTRCTDSSKFQYRPGTTYEYDYDAQTQTSMNGASEDRANIRITAKVKVEVLSKCEFALQLTNVVLHRSDPNNPSRMTIGDNSRDFQQSLESFPLRFSFQDGIVEELCPDDSESNWALNIKRGILTSFQNSMHDLNRDQRVHETDVTGSCVTDYHVIQRGHRLKTIRKTKTLEGCDDRHGYRTAIHAMPYKIASAVQSMPLMKSSHECDHVINRENILQKSSCREMHVFRPFSKDDNGAVTESTQTLEFTRSHYQLSTRQGYITKRTKMTFQHAHGTRDEDLKRHDARQKLENLCRVSVEDIRPEVPGMFSDLVYIMREMNVRGLESLFHQIQKGYICPNNARRTRKFFIDAIPMVGTRASVQLTRQMIQSKEVDTNQANMWLTSLVFIQNPTRDMLEEIQPLMELDFVKNKAHLAISSLVNNYCIKNPSCTGDREVMKIISNLEKEIGTCDITNSNLLDTLETLRAIGNAGHSERLGFSLEKCLNNKKNPAEIRVAAMDAYRRLPCSTDRNNIMEIFRNTDEDSELRIAAYIVVMQCPVPTFLDQIQATLESEKADQVGSFVWSHLTNLMDTSSPFKQPIRKILEDETLKKEFDMDKRKFSRNYEGSFFLDKINAGAMLESNVIWSSRSFLPRSAMVNFTVDLFGKSVNLLEIGGRVEGLEYLLESYFGPEGIFKGQSDTKGYADTRSVRKEKMQRQKKQYNQLKDEFRAALYMRVFGNELRYMHFDSLDLANGGRQFNILEHLIKLSKKHDYTYTQSFMFLDSSLIVPTSTGLPLNLTVNGTATVDIKASGKFDVRKLQSQKSLLLDGEIQPSGAVEIASAMSVDAFVTKVGLKMVSTLHSSSSVKGRLELQGGKIFSLEFDLPKDKIEVFDFKSKFFITHDSHQREQKMIEENRKFKRVCSGTRLARLTGVELCSEVSFPNASMNTKSPYFPFTGPVSIGFVLQKRDVHSKYQMVIKTWHNKETTVGQIAFDTPGSKVNRALSLDMTIRYKNNDVEISLISPWKKANLKGELANTDKLKKVTGRLVVDDSKEYFITAELPVNRKAKKTVYSPNFEVRWPNSQGVRFTGMISLQSLLDRVETNLTISGVPEFPEIKLHGLMVNTQTEKSIKGSLLLKPKEEYSMMAKVFYKKGGKRQSEQVKFIPTLSIKTPKGELLSVAGTVDFKKNKALKTAIELNMKEYLKTPVHLTSSLSKSDNPKLKKIKYKANVNLACEFISWKLLGSFDQSKKTSNLKAYLDYKVPHVTKNRITVGGKFTNRSTKSLKKYVIIGNMDVTANPEYNFLIDVDLNHNRHLSEMNVKAKHGRSVSDKKDKRQQLTVSALLNHKNFDSSPPGSIDYSIKADYPYQNIHYQVKGDHGWSKNSFTSSLDVRNKSKTIMEAMLRLRDQSKKHKKLDATFNLKYSGRDISLFSNFTETKRREYLHIFNFQHQKGEKSTAVTRYKASSKNLHEITTDVLIYGYSPLHLEVSTKLNWQDFLAKIQGQYQDQRYGIDVSSKTDNRPYGKWAGLVRTPYKTVKASIEGGKKGKKYIGNTQIAWDVDKDDHAKITLESSFTPDLQKGVVNKITGNVYVTTPFDNARRLSGEMTYVNKHKHFTYKTKLDWGGKNKELSVNVDFVKPFNINNIDVTLAATTPFEVFNDIKVSLIHQNDKALLSQLKGKWGPKYFDVKIEESHMISKTRRNIEAQFEFKSSIPHYKTMGLSLKHNDNGNIFKTKAVANDNGDQYIYDMNANLMKIGWEFKLDATLDLQSPDKSILTSIHHSHSSLNTMKSTFESQWGPGQNIYVEISASHENIINRKIRGVILIKTPWDEVRDVEININHEQGNGLIQSNSFYKHDRRTKGKVDVSYRNVNGAVDLDFSLINPYMQDLKSKMNGRYGLQDKTGHFEVQWSHSDKISVDGSFNINNKTFDHNCHLRIVTPFEGVHSVLINTKSLLEGNERVSNFDVEFGTRKYLNLEIRHVYDETKKLRCKVDTSLFETVYNVEAGFEMAGSYLTGLTANVDLKVHPIMGKISANLNSKLKPEFYTKLRIDTPFKQFYFLEITSSNQERQSGDGKAYLEIKYYPLNVLRFDTTYDIKNWNDLKTSFDIKTPFKVVPKLGAEVLFKKTDTVMEGKALVTTPFKKVKNVDLAFSHMYHDRNIQTRIESTYGDNKQVKAELHLMMNEVIDGSFTFQSPFDPISRIHMGVKHKGTLQDFKSHAELSFGNQRFEVDSEFLHNANTLGSMSVKTPYKGFEDLKAEFAKQGLLRDIDIRGLITYGNLKKKIEVSLKQKHTDSSQFFISTMFKSPYTNDFALMLDHDSEMSPFYNNFTVTYGRDYAFNSDTHITMHQGAILVKAIITYHWKQNNSNIEMTFKKDGNLGNFDMEISAICDGKEYKVTTAFKNGDKIEGNFNMELPIKTLPQWGFSFDHSGDDNRFVTNGKLNWRDDEFIKGSLDFFRVGIQRVEATLDVTTHFEDYESNTVHYQHHVKKTKIKAGTNVVIGKKGPYAIDLSATRTSPKLFEYTLTANTPHSGYKHLKVQGEVRITDSHVFISGRTDAGKHGDFSFECNADVTSNPIIVSLKVITPFEDFKYIHVSLTHSGRLDDFNTLVSFSSPRTGIMSGEMFSQYLSRSSMDAHLTLKTEYEQFSYLKLVLRRSTNGPKKLMHTEVGWNKNKPVTFDIEYAVSPKDFLCGTSVTTPFKNWQSFSCNLHHMLSDKNFKEVASAAFNGKMYLDADMEYDFGSRHEGSINVRQPMPMEATMSYSLSRTALNNELFINWDKDTTESNVRFVINYNNRLPQVGEDADFKIKIIHPARVLGVEGVFTNMPKHLHKKVFLTWDQSKGNSIGYDVEWLDQSTWNKNSHENNVILILPKRNVKARGVFSNSSLSKSLDVSFLWDADRDQRKQVGLKVDCDIRGKSRKTDLVLHLPAINKDYKLGTDVILNHGNTIFDGRLDFSYSRNPVKTIALTSKFEKLYWNEMTGDRNYSLAFGLTHPATDVNIQVTSHLGQVQSRYSGGVDVVYLTADRIKRNVVLRGELDKLRQQIDLQATTPLENIHLQGKMDTNLPYHVTVKKMYDNSRTMNAEVVIDPRTRNLEFFMSYDADKPQDKIYVSAKYLNDSAVQAEVHRVQDSQPLSESLIAVRLNTSHILHTKITWRPRALMELQQYLSMKSQIATYEVTELLKAVNKAVAKEVVGKYSVIAREVSEELDPIFNFFEKELGNIQLNLNEIKTQMRRFYRRNDLYVQDLGQSVNMAFNVLVRSLKTFAGDFQQFYIKTEMALTQFTNAIKSYPMAQKYAEFVNDVINNLKMAKQIAQAKLNEWSMMLDELSAKLYRMYLDSSRKLRRNVEGIMRHPNIQMLQSKFNEIQYNINALPNIDYSKYVTILDNHIQNTLDKLQMKDTYNNMLHRTNEVVRTQMHAVMNDPDVQKAHAVVNELYQQGKWAYNYWSVDQTARAAMMKLYELIKDALFREVNALKNAWVDLDKSRIIVYDPQHGQLQFEIYLPIPLKSLAHAPTYSINKYVKKATKFITRYVPGSNHSVWDPFNNFITSLDSTQWLNSLNGYGAVVGNQHFITFDKTHFDFAAGRCSYVLARDMVDDNFTVILNYNSNYRNPEKESILVMLRGVNIEVNKNSQVKVNDVRVELPFIQKKIVALKENHVIRIKDGSGMMVEVDTEHDIHTVQLSAWYHGRTAGLLGTYDNNKANDMMTSSHEIVSDITRFVNSWEIGHKKCRSMNAARKVDASEDKDGEHYKTCASLFLESGSQMRRCYSEVEPVQFFDMCMEYLNKRMTLTEAKCLAATQYHHLCRQAGVYLQVPTECVSCSTMYQDRFVKAIELSADKDTVPLSADVVLVYEEKKTDIWTPITLGSLVHEIDKALSASHLGNNMFGLVGYGGLKQLIKAHTHTFNGEIFGTAVSFLKGVEDIQYSPSKVPGNALDALRYATHLPFRTGVSKLIVFIPALACEASVVSSDMEQHLKSNGFTLHILRNDRLEINNNRSLQNTVIFGVDKQQLLTYKNRNRNSGLFNDIKIPSDQCSSLAMATNGSIFDSGNMRSSNVRVQRDFTRKFAARVASTAAPPQCQRCTCEQDGYGKSKTVCKPCDRSFSLWSYVPNWWNSNRTPGHGTDFDELRDYLALDKPLGSMEIQQA